MLKRLFIALILLCFTVPCLAQTIVVAKKKAVASCTTAVTPEETGASSGSTNITQTTGTDWMAGKFVTPDPGYTVCKVDLYLRKSGTLSSGTITFTIRGHDAAEDDPDDNTICTLGTINMADVPASETAISFTSLNCPLSASTAYWIVSSASAATGTTNYISWHYESNGATEVGVYDADGTGTWTDLFTTNTFKFKMYKE